MDRKDFALNDNATTMRLETPHASGYRVGMSSSSMIARKLERLYNPPGDMPRAICDMLEVLDRTTAHGR